ncbi:hypothetical protein GCM10009804_62990 [Kribbella hippodromi]|uniref:Secreted protein n=1 Tax=Kribbella hippodromi TaxID=434347 RepID=A0ABN2E9F9_9ACTN
MVVVAVAGMWWVICQGPGPQTAYPSMADRSTGGTATGEISGAASMQPGVSLRSRETADPGRATAWASWRAVSHETWLECAGRWLE